MLKQPAAMAREHLDMMTGTTVAASNYNGALVRLYSARSAPIGADSALADFTICDFTGYAEQAVASWGPAATGEDDVSYTVGANVQFTPTAGVTEQTVQGYIIVDSGGTKLLAAEDFPEAKTVDEVGDDIAFAPVLRMK